MTPRMEVHFHSKFSNVRLLDATYDISEAVDYAVKIGLKGLCLTDHGNVCGWIKANQKQKELNEKGIDFKIGLGEEGYLVDERKNGIKYYHCIWIAKDEIGARQIRRISSIANLNSYMDRGLERVPITKEEFSMVIKENPGHIIMTSACLGGELSSNILEMEKARKENDEEKAKQCHNNIVKFVLWAKDLVGDDFYMEIAPAASKEQIIVNKEMVEIAKVFNCKMVIGSDAHYLTKEDKYVHNAFLNSRGGERETEQFYAYAYLQTEEEIKENLKLSIVDLYEEMCGNSMEIWNKINVYSLEHPQQIPHVEVEDYPEKNIENEDFKKSYPTLTSMLSSKDKIERCWINRCLNKLEEINKKNDIYLSELEEEAEVKRIVGKRLNTNMFSYPLTLSHYIDKFWELGSSVGAGRGSACSALNHYLLGITQLDPIEWGFPFFRYMNKDTDGLGDIDIDLAPSKIQTILSYIKAERGNKFEKELKLTEIEKKSLGAVYVCTFGTESSKSSVLTSCRGYRSEEYPNGIDNDIAQYLSSLIPVERGFVWSISEVYYGNPDKDRKPVTPFVQEVDKYPGLLDIMLGVEGIVSRKGRHASGVLFLDEDPYQFNAYMKTPSGEVTTQWDLHDVEWSGSTKFDLLVTAVQDKIIVTIKFLQEDNQIKSDLSLKEAYDEYLHPDVLPLKDKQTWKAIQEASVLDLFQLDSDIGRQGAKKIKPDSMIELSSVNGLIRLMNAEGETWLDKYVRFKNNKVELIDEINKYNLSEKEKKALGKYLEQTNGIGISQEQMMRVLMDSNLCNFSLKEANKARKIVSKKRMKEIPAFKEKVFTSAVTPQVAKYIWDYVVAPGLGYSFSDIHSLSYSFIGFQTAYLGTHWNPIYWNTACLVVNSGSLEEEKSETVSLYEQEDEEYIYEDLPDRTGKKKTKTTDYTKLAKAIGDITEKGIQVSLININSSDYGFKPDVKNNRILYGLKALSNINNETIELIKQNRPYSSFKDFLNKCPLKKVAIINLIKAGAFDEIDPYFNNRKEIMVYYILQICEAKKKLTLQNFNGLLQQGLIPKELEMQIRIYNFNKYLKAYQKKNEYYELNEPCLQFFERFLSDYLNQLEFKEQKFYIEQKKWEKIYKNYMEIAKDWLKENQEEVLKNYNEILFKGTWDKYASGSTSYWEMESLCFYHGEHELAGIDNKKYGIVNFNNLKSEEIDYFFKRNGRMIPIYKLYRIAGTVLAKNDTRHNISLLTTDGVVSVKFTSDQYAKFKKQISQIQPDGTKKVVEKGWFKRGTKLVVTGYRQGDSFKVKTYKNSGSHQIYKITNIIGDEIQLVHDRFTDANTIEE